MTIEELGSLGELLAAIATIVTLGYLALQIRQSNRSHQLAAISRFSEGTDSWIGQIVKDPELHDIYRRGLFDPESLSREERGRFELLVMQFLRSTETGWHQVEWGVADRDYWAGYRETIKFIVGSHAGRRSFERNRKFLAVSFVAEVDRILAEDVG